MLVARPYIYAYDGQGLTDGSNTNITGVKTDAESEFMLRRIVGARLLVGPFVNGGNLSVYDTDSQNILGTGARIPNSFPIAPQKRWPRNSQIQFQIANVQRQANAYVTPGSVPNYWSTLGFAGIKVLENEPYETPYRYQEVGWRIRNTFTLTTGRVAPAYTVIAPTILVPTIVQDMDFQWMGTNINIQVNGGTWQPSIGKMKVLFQDQNEYALSNGFVPDTFVNSGSPGWGSVWPTVPLLFSIRSSIRMQVASLLVEAESPAQCEIIFTGIRRVACL